MSYFSRFPLLRYTSNNTVTITSDVLKRVAVNQKTKENLVLFDEYDIQEGETPETVSYKFYETTDYHWVILIVNDILDPRYGWPLKGDELYEYTAAKYGSGNVNAVHHYTISETNDIIVDPTQPVTTKSLYLGSNNFPSNIDVLFNYASNGSSTASLTSYEKELVNFLQQSSTKPLPGTGVLYRADIDHSFDNPTRFGATILDALSALKIASSQEAGSDPDGPGPLPVQESFNQHIVYYGIKPIVDSGNTTLLSYLTSTATAPTSTVGLVSTYYSGGLYYSITSTWSSTLLSMASGSVSNPPLYSFLSQPAQSYYLNGDITGTTRLSGIQYGGANTDAKIALTYQQGNLASSHPHYGNVVALLANLVNNSSINVALESVTYPYANAFEVTNIAHETNINESKRRIRILKAEYLSAFVTEFERLINV